MLLRCRFCDRKSEQRKSRWYDNWGKVLMRYIADISMHVAQDKHDKERRDLLEYFLVNSDGGTVREYLSELGCEEVR